MSYISVEHLSFSLWTRQYLKILAFTVEPGQFIDFDWENQTAKSALVKNILGLLTPKIGKATIAKIAMARSYPIGYAPQQDSFF